MEALHCPNTAWEDVVDMDDLQDYIFIMRRTVDSLKAAADL
jgi:hypothetical protein